MGGLELGVRRAVAVLAISCAFFVPSKTAAQAEAMDAFRATLGARVAALLPTSSAADAFCAQPFPEGVACARSDTPYPCTGADGRETSCTQPRITLTLRAPAPAAELARALGVARPRLLAIDRHMSHRVVMETRASRPNIEAWLPVRGRFALQLTVDDVAPSTLTRERAAASDVYTLGRSSVVSIEIWLDDLHARPGVAPRLGTLAPGAPTPDELVGVWSSEPDVGAGYGPLLILRADGTFARRPQERETGCGDPVAEGTWFTELDAIVLDEIARPRRAGRCPSPATRASRTRSVLSTCEPSEDEAGAGPCRRVAGHPWWQLMSDPADLPAEE